MSQFTRLMIICLLYLMGAGPATGATSESSGIGKVDLTKTVALFQEWAARNNFPDTVPLAYYNAYGQLTLQGELSPGARSTLFSFIKRCQRPDGGFVSNRKYPSKPNIVYTYFALDTLRIIGSLDGIDQAKATAYVHSLIRDDGSIAPSVEELDRSTLGSTYYGIEALKILGKTELIDREKTTAFVLGHRNEDGGFGVLPHGASSPQGVALATQILAALGGVPPEIVPSAVAYLEQATAQLGLSGKRHRAFSTMQAAADTLSALAAMNALKDAELSLVADFVADRFVPENGGFGPYPSYGTTPPSTYQGVYCLKILGKPPLPLKLPGSEAGAAPATAAVFSQKP